MARAAGASRWRLVTRVLFPGALPGVLVGLRFALAYSILGLVVAEQINANSGIGFMITKAQTTCRTDQMFLGLVIYAILGLLADQFVRVLRARAAALAAPVTRRHEHGNRSAAPGSRRARSPSGSSAASASVSCSTASI